MSNKIEELDEMMDSTLRSTTSLNAKDVSIMRDKLKVGWPNIDSNTLNNYGKILLMLNLMDDKKAKISCGDGKTVDAQRLHDMCVYIGNGLKKNLNCSMAEFFGKSMAVGKLVYDNLDKLRKS